MKLLIVAITFGVTIGGLFLFENHKTAPKEENYAQIVQGLANQNQSKTPTPKPANKSSIIPTKTPTPSFTTIPIPSPTSSFTMTPAATLPSILPTSSPTPTPTSTITSSAEPTPTPTPTTTPTQSTDQILVVSLTSPVEQNATAQLEIKTAPEAQCAIKVTLPSGSQSTAKGLEDKTADNSGAISWSWKINWNTTPGTANIDITCSRDGLNFSKSLQMVIIER